VGPSRTSSSGCASRSAGWTSRRQALKLGDRPGSFGHAASLAVPPHLSEDRLEAGVDHPGGRRHRKPRVHRRWNHRSISDKPPASYIPPLIQKSGTEAFENQAIPTDDALLKLGGYREFLRERRIRTAAALNSFLDG
jgi:hypothetical protein